MAAAAMLGGSMVNGFMEYEKAQKEGDMLQQQANEYFLENVEIREREALNVQSLQEQGRQLKGEQAVSFAGKGAVLRGSPLLFMEAQQAKVREEIANVHREADYNVNTNLRQGTTLLNESFSTKADSGKRAFTTFLGGASQAMAVGSNSNRAAPRTASSKPSYTGTAAINASNYDPYRRA